MPDLGLDLLIIDGRHLLWRSMSVFMGLGVEDENHDKIETGGIYGFLRLALGCWIKFGGKGVATVVAWDRDEGPTERRKMFADYKQKPETKRPKPGGTSITSEYARASEREVTREALLKQEAKLKDILALLGISQASAPGWEADDVIATLCAKFNSRVGILSGDRDLLQLVTNDITLIRPLSKGQFALETPETVRAEHGVEPAQILDLKALGGDSGDNVPGARGIGPKGAAKLIQAHGGWEQAVQVAGETAGDKTLAKVAASEANIRLSARLVTLNREARLEFIPTARNGKQAFLELTKLYFNSLMADGRREMLMQMGGES